MLPLLDDSRFDILRQFEEAKDFFDGVKRVYVTFASMKTKLVVERYLKRTNYRKALRLPQYCCK